MKSSSAASRYFDQASESRVLAPRIGHRLCIVWQPFSARFSTLNCGKWKFISAGASVSGVSWKTISMPSMQCRSTGCSMLIVGAIRLLVPRPMALPRPLSTCERGPGASVGPNWNSARRRIGTPARMFSAIAASMKPSGAITFTSPLAACAGVITPSTPP